MIPDNPKDSIGRAKPGVRHVPAVGMFAMGAVMDLGADKYGPFNWREAGVAAEVYGEAIDRHLAKWRDREEVDPESRQSHLAHIMACCAILIDAEHVGKLIDDRPKVPGNVSAWLEAHPRTPAAPVPPVAWDPARTRTSREREDLVKARQQVADEIRKLLENPGGRDRLLRLLKAGNVPNVMALSLDAMRAVRDAMKAPPSPPWGSPA